jgi:hypothetical protein
MVDNRCVIRMAQYLANWRRTLSAFYSPFAGHPDMDVLFCFWSVWLLTSCWPPAFLRCTFPPTWLVLTSSDVASPISPHFVQIWAAETGLFREIMGYLIRSRNVI